MSRSILLFGLIVLMFGGATAGIIKVPADYTTIQSGINAAFPGDTVLVADGTYYENIDFKGKAITVASYFLIDEDTTHINTTIINGSKPSDPNKSSVVSFVSREDTSSVLCGFTITAGSGTFNTPNSAQAGGGIFCYNSGSKIIANKIINNSVIGPRAVGGGLAAQPMGSNAWVVLKDNQITRCNGRLTGNEISYNEIWDYSNIGTGAVGVVVGASPDSFLIESNIIRNNAYKHGTGDCYGGGLQLWGPGSISVINNLIKGNIATFGGGVVDAINTALYGMVLLVNNTIINNIATYGDGIYFLNTTAPLMNNIIWGNQAPTNAAIHTYTSIIYAAYSDVQGGWTGIGNINLDPQLVADGLSNSSACIGKGIASYDFGGGMMCHCPVTDIAGHSRPDPAGSNPDMGVRESPLEKPIDTKVLNSYQTEIPQSFYLAQNYPNPFSASGIFDNPKYTLNIHRLGKHNLNNDIDRLSCYINFLTLYVVLDVFLLLN